MFLTGSQININNYLHYISMQEYRLGEMHYICRLLTCILLYTLKPLAQDKLIAQQAE